MPGSEARGSRKALAALLRFVSRDAACGPRSPARSGRITLARTDGSSLTVDAGLLAAALGRGLVTDKVSQAGAGGARVYAATPEGRAALRRWLCDPDSAFQDQHRTLAAASDPEQGQMSVNLSESPLAALARIRTRDGALYLDPAQVEAGERLRADFTRGQMLPSLGQRWEPVRTPRQPGAAGGGEITDAALSARLRVDAALDDVGPELAGVLVDVCCFLKGLGDIERERQWPARAAKLMLRTALAALARHYDAPRRPRVSRPPAPPPHAP
ncbi:DUF6456 domain-containing protein [Hoeflea sp. BAL378]|uniref:DUF6456 domain-containing protein n=1 Tax=Hoeflea sp. BAL378 TaxID=1547437 RepID=UPI00068A87BB|nr:DUF6456 domain-containing protein [Hoeflea sp. BAL378]